MSHILRLIGTVAGVPSPFDGQCVVRYDPTPIARGEQPILVTTPFEVMAKRFDTAQDAIEYWRMESGVYRDDLLPDRPLTAWSVEVADIGD